MDSNGDGDVIEMQPVGGAAAAGDDDDGEYFHDVFEEPHMHQNQRIDDDASPTSPSRKNGLSASSRRVRRNYLIIVLIAYILTLLSPGTMLWSSPSFSSCKNPSPRISSKTNTAYHVTNSSLDSMADGHEYIYNSTKSTTNRSDGHTFSNGRQSFHRCMYASVNIRIFAKLTFSMMILFMLFFNIQGSNAGLLTVDVMARLDALESTTNHATNASNRSGNHDEEMADLERESFLEPLPLKQTKATISLSQITTLPRPKDQKLYPHTRRKYCDKCKIHPPLRSHHCNICKRCVATFDHHCLFLDTCIGERNHFRFWLFVLWNVICLRMALGIVGSSGSLWSMLGHRTRLGGTSIELQIGQAILILAKLYMYPIYGIATILCMIHTSLALCNTTTFEISKGPHHIDYLWGTKMMDFPFGKGLFSNTLMFFSRDDVFSWIKGFRKCKKGTCFGRLGRILHLQRCNICCGTKEKTPKTQSSSNDWVPILWKMPDHIERESEDWWNHPWQNKYWSCC